MYIATGVLLWLPSLGLANWSFGGHSMIDFSDIDFMRSDLNWSTVADVTM